MSADTYKDHPGRLKPHKGELTNWRKKHLNDSTNLDGFDVIIGLQGDYLIRTSAIVSQEGDKVETHNSYYTLVGPEA